MRYTEFVTILKKSFPNNFNFEFNLAQIQVPINYLIISKAKTKSNLNVEGHVLCRGALYLLF